MRGHKYIILSVVSPLIFSFSFVASASTVIFSDGFESDFSNWTGNDPKWDTSGGNVHGGTKRGEVKGNTEPGDDVLLKNISTSGYDEIVLEFWYRIKESLEDDDHVYVEWAGNGSNWNILNDFTSVATSATWEFSSYTIPAEASDKTNFAIRFRAHLGAVTSDIFYLDDVVVSADSVPESTSTPTPEATPTPSTSSGPTASPSSTPVSTPSAGSTNSPQATLAPPSTTPTPTLTSTFSPKPSSSPQVTLMPSKTLTPIPTVISSPKPVKQDQEQSSNITPTPLEDLSTANQSPEPDNSSASISNFFNNSKFFWLISAMVLAVVFSLAKSKKD